MIISYNQIRFRKQFFAKDLIIFRRHYLIILYWSFHHILRHFQKYSAVLASPSLMVSSSTASIGKVELEENTVYENGKLKKEIAKSSVRKVDLCVLLNSQVLIFTHREHHSCSTNLCRRDYSFEYLSRLSIFKWWKWFVRRRNWSREIGWERLVTGSQ